MSLKSDVCSSVNNESKAQESHKEPELTTLLAGSPAISVLPAPLLDISLQQLLPVNASLASLTANRQPPSTLTTDGLDPMDIDTRSSATQPTSNPDPMAVDKEKGEETHGSSSTDLGVVTVPAWLTMLDMDKYLQQCSDMKEWQELVQ